MPPSQKTWLLYYISLCVFAILCTVHDINPGTSNKLLLLNVDCSTHNETSEHSETHQASRNPTRTKTNIWSCKLSLHHHASRPTLQFETLLDDWTNKSQHFECLAFGGQISNHISFLLLYVWAGRRRCGIQRTDEGGREGLVGFCWKHNWHGPGDIVRQIVLCLSVCIRRAPAMFH